MPWTHFTDTKAETNNFKGFHTKFCVLTVTQVETEQTKQLFDK